jgi:3-hydroxyacyl-[acyl-carrier-protein] dehydratase
MDTIRNLHINDIQKYQMNRHPVLFVDQISEVVPGKYAIGKKCFSFNEWFFPGHFPDEPSVPGFIQVECLAQVFIMTFFIIPEYTGKKTSFAAIKNTMFKRKIIPGEVLISHAKLVSFKRGIAIGVVEGRVKDEIACCADFVIAIPEVLNVFTPDKR